MLTAVSVLFKRCAARVSRWAHADPVRALSYVWAGPITNVVCGVLMLSSALRDGPYYSSVANRLQVGAPMSTCTSHMRGHALRVSH